MGTGWWEWSGWGEADISCLSFPGILGMVELGAQSITYELAIIVYMVSAQDPLFGRGGSVLLSLPRVPQRAKGISGTQ